MKGRLESLKRFFFVTSSECRAFRWVLIPRHQCIRYDRYTKPPVLIASDGMSESPPAKRVFKVKANIMDIGHPLLQHFVVFSESSHYFLLHIRAMTLWPGWPVGHRSRAWTMPRSQPAQHMSWGVELSQLSHHLPGDFKPEACSKCQRKQMQINGFIFFDQVCCFFFPGTICLYLQNFGMFTFHFAWYSLHLSIFAFHFACYLLHFGPSNVHVSCRFL